MSGPTGSRVAEALAQRGIIPFAHPEHAPGCYVMHFYCRYRNPEHPYRRDLGGGLYMEEADQVETRTAAIRQMRECGWIYHSDGTATCPLCAKAIREARHDD